MFEIIGNADKLTKAEWLALRGIGGSTVGAIMGFSTFDTPYTVWARLITGEQKEFTNNDVEFGTFMEPVIRACFAKMIRKATGRKIRVTRNPNVMRSLEYPFLTANIDGDIDDPIEGLGVLEVKTAGSFNKGFNNGEIPDSYYAQIQYYMWFTERKYAYIAYLKDKRFDYARIDRNEGFINSMLETVLKFWNDYVLTNTPPPMLGGKTESEMLSEKYGVSDPEKVVDLTRMKDTVDEIRLIKETISRFEKDKGRLENEIRDALGEAEVGLLGDTDRVTWKVNARGTRILKI